MRTNDFVRWLGSELLGGMLPSQVNAVKSIMDRLPAGDLLVVMLEGDDEMSAQALRLLKKKFQGYEYEMEQIATAQSEAMYEAWH